VVCRGAKIPPVTAPRAGDQQLSSPVAIALAGVVGLPLAGLILLLVAPSTDVRWEHHPSHFWLVLFTAVVAALLGWSVGVAARRRADARLFLVSLAFFVAAAFLGLHALATPRVLLDGSNAGFVLATPVGLLLASVFALWSALPLDGDRARWVMAHTGALRGTVIGVVAIWAVWSLSSWSPLDDPTPPESGSTFLLAIALPGVVLYAIAAWRYLLLAQQRRSEFLTAIAASWLLLAEAMIAVTWARNWRASWWEWHVLMLLAFAAIAWAANRLPESERFGDLYLDEVAGGTRDVSVLFADLAGFTSFSEHAAPEEVQAMLNTYFDATLPAIRDHGARLDRFLGDAVMVTFNVAAEQPDHATDAARAALAFQAAAGEVARRHASWPRFRVGVNTGPAVVGVVGDGADRGYTVLGDTVNVAARLQALAPEGGVAIGGATLRRLRGAQVSPLGELAVKGRREPVEAWRLEAMDHDGVRSNDDI
jgi:class 3 adenylate cyclase